MEQLLRWGANEKLTNVKGRTAGKTLGKWAYARGNRHQRMADEARILYMLAHAPADRSWCRRGCLVMARSCPTKVQLTVEGNSGGRGSRDDAAEGGGGNGTESQTRIDLERLVGAVVGLDEEGVFRSVVGFLRGEVQARATTSQQLTYAPLVSCYRNAAVFAGYCKLRRCHKVLDGGGKIWVC